MELMPFRASLHTMIDMLADFGIFEGRAVKITVTNGTQIAWDYDPPIVSRAENEIAFAEKTLFARRLQ